MAWYKKLFGISEAPREVTTGIEIGPGIQLMSGDQLEQQVEVIEHKKDESRHLGVQEVLSLQEQINSLSAHLTRLQDLDVARQNDAYNEQVRVFRASAYPGIAESLEAIFEGQEGRPEKLQALLARRAKIKELYPKIGQV